MKDQRNRAPVKLIGCSLSCARDERRDRGRWRISFSRYQVVLLSYGVEFDRPPRSTDRAAWPCRPRSLRFGAAGIDEPARDRLAETDLPGARPARAACAALWGPRGGSLTSMVWWEWRRGRAVLSRSGDIVDGGGCRVGRNVKGGRAPLRSVADTPGFDGGAEQH